MTHSGRGKFRSAGVLRNLRLALKVPLLPCRRTRNHLHKVLENKPLHQACSVLRRGKSPLLKPGQQPQSCLGVVEVRIDGDCRQGRELGGGQSAGPRHGWLSGNVEALKEELLYAQAMLENAKEREIRSPALKELLHKLRQLAYNADDMLDELEYFRIQDELDGTYHAADAHAAGCVRDLALNARHTARAVAAKLKPSCGSHAEDDDQDNSARQGCLSSLCSCGGRTVSSSPPSPTNQDDQKISGRCMQKLASITRKSACCVGNGREMRSSPSSPTDQSDKKVGCGCLLKVKFPASNTARYSIGNKLLPCCSFQSVDGNEKRILCGAWRSKLQQRKHISQQESKLKFNRVEVSEKITDIIKHLKLVSAKVSKVLNLQFMGTNRITRKDMQRPETTPNFTEKKLYGRDVQKRRVLGIIDSFANGKLVVLPIVGPGGIGKTTFMQQVYQEMKSHFDTQIWICVSLNFNASRLTQEAVKRIPKVEGEKGNSSDQELIEQRLKDKRVDCPIKMERLEGKDFMDFFEACVFGDQTPWEGDTESLFDVGKEIVSKLKGFPLAAKTVGRLLRNRLTLEHWNRVLHSKEWELQTNDNYIMPALKLSYEYLPFHLQQCFYYCALFPEDYEFDGKELVHLWIGLDIVHPCDLNRRIEDVGQTYLDDLVNHGFFKKNERNGGCPYYVVHDLLHDLAVNISSFECLTICSSNSSSIQIRQDVRHLSIIVDEKDVGDIKTFKYYKNDLRTLGNRLKVENLRTLMVFGEHHGSFANTFCDLFEKAIFLRVIYLSKAAYTMEDMAHKFSKLIHLRYLRITTADEEKDFNHSALSRLYHLEVIDLPECLCHHGSTRLMSNLPKLRHFIVPEDELRLHSNIIEAGKLKMLQELRRFEVRKEDKGFELSQLGQLSELGGSLAISNLERIHAMEEAHEARLIQLKRLQKLTLEWDADQHRKDTTREENVLEILVPQINLQDLCIIGHGGTKRPQWLGENLGVKNLESLCLDGVAWELFPAIGELRLADGHYAEISSRNIPNTKFQNLRRLEFLKLQRLEEWVVDAPCQLFAHLKVLIIKDCPKLTKLSFSHSTCYHQEKEVNINWFPSLQELEIEYCPELQQFPRVPWRGAPCSATITGVGSGLKQLVWEENSNSECSMEIEGKDASDMMLWDMLVFPNLTKLKELTMVRCPPLSMHHLQMLSSLKDLTVSDSTNVFVLDGRVVSCWGFVCLSGFLCCRRTRNHLQRRISALSARLLQYDLFLLPGSSFLCCRHTRNHLLSVRLPRWAVMEIVGIQAARWVIGKALGPASGGVLELNAHVRLVVSASGARRGSIPSFLGSPRDLRACGGGLHYSTATFSSTQQSPLFSRVVSGLGESCACLGTVTTSVSPLSSSFLCCGGEEGYCHQGSSYCVRVPTSRRPNSHFPW
ncbi:hypothetical protein BS78_06G237000 [Paspalum vaginatum]|nr:hypothetical protein BS78_06G237000 [Paspalum vaginatum]